jgi:hypothetical protein
MDGKPFVFCGRISRNATAGIFRCADPNIKGLKDRPRIIGIDSTIKDAGRSHAPETRTRRMSVLRFLTHTVLACWVAVTAVVVATALQWFTAGAAAEVKVQRALNAQKEANNNSITDSWQDPGDTPQQQEAAAERQRNYNRLVLKSESANEEMSEAIHLAQIERKHFWTQIAVWAGLTLLGSALLAEKTGRSRRSSEGLPWPGAALGERDDSTHFHHSGFKTQPQDTSIREEKWRRDRPRKLQL